MSTDCLTELFPIYQKKKTWTVRWLDDHSVEPSSHHITYIEDCRILSQTKGGCRLQAASCIDVKFPFRFLHSGSLCMVYYEQGSFSLVCFHGWLNYPVRNNHLYSFYTRLKLQWIVDHIISYIWLLSICGSQKTQLDSFFSHQSNIYIQSKSSAIIYRSEFMKNSNIRKG